MTTRARFHAAWLAVLPILAACGGGGGGGGTTAVVGPTVVTATFPPARSLTTERTMTVRVHGPTSSKEIVASLPTDRYNAYVNTLLWSLGGFIVVTGIIVAAVAGGIASSTSFWCGRPARQWDRTSS